MKSPTEQIASLTSAQRKAYDEHYAKCQAGNMSAQQSHDYALELALGCYPHQTARHLPAWKDAQLLRSAVRTLNAQHRNTSAGFYGLGSRFFRARARAGVLEVFDFETWTAVPEDKAQFHDHNGRDIPLA